VLLLPLTLLLPLLLPLPLAQVDAANPSVFSVRKRSTQRRWATVTRFCFIALQSWLTFATLFFTSGKR
jgi:hypothetical protein